MKSGPFRRVFRFKSLQQKLGVYSFVVALSAMAVVSLLSYRVARTQVQNDRKMLMESLVWQIAQDLEAELDSASRDVLLWGGLEPLIELVGKRDAGKAGRILDELALQRQYYDLLLIIGHDGRIAAATSSAKELVGQSYAEILPNLPTTRFQEISQSTGLVWTIDWQQNNRINRLRGRTAEIKDEVTGDIDHSYQIGLAAPLRSQDSSSPVGIIVVLVNWSHFQDVLDHAENSFVKLGLTTGYAGLYASDGNSIIGHKYKEYYATKVLEDHHVRVLYERLRDNPSGTLSYVWQEGPKTVALGRVADPDVLQPKFDWRLLVGINDEDIFAPVERLGWTYLIIPLAVAMMVALVFLFFSRAISVSLNEIAQLARDAAQGRLSQLARAKSDDELGVLAHAFNQMIVSMRAQIPFSRIPNPYVVGNPLRDSQMFFGRQRELEWIGRQLSQTGNKMILLYGARRIGKTSLLHQVAAGQAGRNLVPFFVDTQQLIPELEKDADFYHLLTRELLEQFPARLPGFRAPFIPTDRYGPDTLRKLLVFVNSVEPQKPPVILFDELENLEYKLARGVLTSDLFMFLAGLLDGETPVSFVATGSSRMDALKMPDWNILVPKTVTRRIGLLNPEYALNLIEEPVRGHVLYDEGIPESILRLTAGHPYYTQLLCQSVVDYLNLKHEFAVGSADLKMIVEQVLSNPPPPLTHVWENLATLDRIAAAGLANALTDEESFVDVEEIRSALPAELQQQVKNVVSLHSSLSGLWREDWVELKELKYRFRIDIFRLWVRHEHSVWHVIEELAAGQSGV